MANGLSGTNGPIRTPPVPTPRSNLFISFVGILVAGLFLVGDWTPFRGEETSLILQVRFWALALLLFFVGLDRLCGRGRTFPVETNRDETRMVKTTFLFLFYILASAIWTPNFYDSLGKVSDIAVIILTLFCFRYFSLAFGRVNFNEAFWRNVLFLGTVFALLILSSGLLTEKQRINALGGGPNTFGRIMGFLCLAALFYIFVKKRKWCYAVFCTGAILVVMSGSRGSLLAAVVGGLTFLLFSQLKWRKKIFFILLSGGLLTVIMFQTPYGRIAGATFQRRILKLTFEEGHDAGRMRIYEKALEIGGESLGFGHGLDSFKTYSDKQYPHNIFLEIFVEGGIVGLTLFLIMLFGIFKTIMKHRRFLNAASVAAFALILAASQFSGDLYDSRGVFLLPVLALGVWGKDLPRTVVRRK